MSKGPVLIELEDAPSATSPADAPPVPELVDDHAPEGRAMQTVAVLASRKPSLLSRWFWGLLITIVGMVVSVSAVNFISSLLSTMPYAGYVFAGIIVLFLFVILMILIKEAAAFSRLSRIDQLHQSAKSALAENDLRAAQKVTHGLMRLYSGREDTRWGRDRLKDYAKDQFDADGLLGLAETELLSPLDKAATREIEVAARQVATVTAIVPLAFADVFAALTANVRMIRKIAEIYGGRAGTFGSWRLARAVMTHLVATGAVAVGDDLIGSVAGRSVLSKISRRFGEGLVNGALTARVGVAAMEVCRPLPFTRMKPPSVTLLVKNALTGLFGQG